MKKSLILILIVFLVLLFIVIYEHEGESADTYIQKRKSMVVNQLKNRDIIDSKVLQAMFTIPRHQFVDQRIAGSAYNDYPLSIG
jgi:protein-L-isoaspartate(D-aspartate) O-methyltransferase